MGKFFLYIYILNLLWLSTMALHFSYVSLNKVTGSILKQREDFFSRMAESLWCKRLFYLTNCSTNLDYTSCSRQNNHLRHSNM